MIARLVALVVLLVLAWPATFLLLPVWRWVERNLAIEAIGHSGPADWCFIGLQGLVLVLWATAWVRAHRRRRARL